MTVDRKKPQRPRKSISRTRRAEHAVALRALLNAISEQVSLLEEDMARLYEEQFVETPDEWFVPHIGDLKGLARGASIDRPGSDTPSTGLSSKSRSAGPRSRPPGPCGKDGTLVSRARRPGQGDAGETRMELLMELFSEVADKLSEFQDRISREAYPGTARSRGSRRKSSAVARAFVRRINAHDVAGLCELMTPGHRFIDSTGTVHAGRERMRAGWRHYFEMFPDYRIRIQRMIYSGDRVALFGSTFATYAPNGQHVAMQAAWLAVVRSGRVTEWRVYADNEPARAATRGGR